MATVTQPSAMPTRKLTSAMVSASVVAIIKAFVVHAYPQLSDPIIWEPLPLIVAFAVGYFVKDKPNVTVA